MTAKIIAHNEEIQRMERASEPHRDSRSKVDNKSRSGTDLKEKDDQQSNRLSRGSGPKKFSLPFEPVNQQIQQQFLTGADLHDFEGSPYEAPLPPQVLSPETQEGEQIVKRMLDYLDI